MNAREEINARLQRVGDDVKSASRNLWLAGLGAVGSADEMSREVFSDWVRRGEAVGKGKGPETFAGKRWNEAGDRVKSLGDRLEGEVEERMTQALNRLGVPARRDVEELSDRVAVLTRHVEALR